MKKLLTMATAVGLLCGTNAFPQTMIERVGRAQERQAQRERAVSPTSPSETKPSDRRSDQSTSPNDGYAMYQEAIGAVMSQIDGDVCPEPTIKPFPTEMKFYDSFHPSDTMYEFWCKLHSIKGEGKGDLILTASTKEHNRQRLHTWRFVMDGNTSYAKSDFVNGTVRQLSRFASDLEVGAFFWRATALAGDVGIPAELEQSKYRYYNANLTLSLESIPIMGVPFTLEGSFEMNPGLLTERLAGGKPKYPEFQMSSPNDTKRPNFALNPKGKLSTVGFPLALDMLTLYSEAPPIKDAAPEIKQALLSKYAKYSKGTINDPNRPTDRITRVSDGTIMFVIHEGISETKKPYLQINYFVVPKGKLDTVTAGKEALAKLGQRLAEQQRSAVVEGVKAKKDQNTKF